MTRCYINNGVSIEMLREMLSYCPETGIFTWRVKRGRNAGPGSIAGRRSRTKYVQIAVARKYFSAHRLAWAFHYGEWPTNDIDHINRNPSDNRIANLRLATQSQNNANYGLGHKNTSGYKGVTRLRYAWQAQIQVNGKNHYLGSFRSKEDAALAYMKAAKQFFGDFSSIGGPP